MKKSMTLVLTILFLPGILTSCTNSQTPFIFNENRDISVISREDGSGTRGAFVELFDLLLKTDVKTSDQTTKEAAIADKTGVMLAGVASDAYAIGYVSIGSLNDTVKTLEIDGAGPTPDNVKSGAYKIARPFNIAVSANLSAQAQDFIDFILSAQGQEVVERTGYISAVDNPPTYNHGKVTGKVVVAGSSSVTPVMEKLKEAYAQYNPDVSVEIQMNDSTTGMNAVMDGICDIGMASRDLKDSELAALSPIIIAIDGIAVVVNPLNPIDGLSRDTVKSIFNGEYTKWSQVIG